MINKLKKTVKNLFTKREIIDINSLPEDERIDWVNEFFSNEYPEIYNSQDQLGVEKYKAYYELLQNDVLNRHNKKSLTIQTILTIIIAILTAINIWLTYIKR